MHDVNRFAINRFVLFETARYDNQFLRPYQTHLDGHIGDQLLETTAYGESVSPSSVASVANQFLRPAAQVSHAVGIDNGFDIRRFTFFLEVVASSGALQSGRTRYLLTGYTDHFGVTQDGRSLDPRMRLYFNNLITLRDMEVMGANGMQTVTNVIDNKHILHNSSTNNYPFGNDQQRYMMRPQDLMRHMDITTKSPMLEGAGFAGEEVMDLTTVLHGPKMSARTYESRPNYLHKTIESYQAADANESSYLDDDNTNFYNNARGHHTQIDGTFMDNNFLRVLLNRCNYGQAGFVELSQLASPDILPETYDAAEVITANHAQRQTEYQPGQGENWNASTNETIAASIIQQSIPTLMTDCLLSYISIHATNNVIGGDIEVVPSGYRSLTHGMDMTDHIRHFCTRLKYEVLQDISHNNEMVFMLQLEVNVSTEIRITISIDNEPYVFFAAPLFCDGLYAPVISPTMDNVQEMAHDVDSLMNHLRNPDMAGQSQGPAIDPTNFSL